jgi:hypothetical protein
LLNWRGRPGQNNNFGIIDFFCISASGKQISSPVFISPNLKMENEGMLDGNGSPFYRSRYDFGFTGRIDKARVASFIFQNH